MRKILSFLLGVAAAAMSVVSCQKQEITVSEPVSGLSFVSEKPVLDDQSKTEWDGSTILWSKGDKIRVAYTCDGVWQNANGTATPGEQDGLKTAKLYESNSLASGGSVGEFNVPGNFKGTASGIYKFYGVYPSSVCADAPDFKFAPSLTVVVPSIQTPLANSFDPAADVMLAKSAQTYTGLPKESVPMLWNRFVAHAEFTFSNIKGFGAGERIVSIELTANPEADMVDKHYVLLDQMVTERASSSAVTNVLTLKGDNLAGYENGTVKAWAAFLPATVTSLKVVITTDQATYTREIPTCNLTFKQNARSTLNVKMNEAVRTELTVSGTLPFDEGFDTVTGQSQLKTLERFDIHAGSSVYGGRQDGSIRLGTSKAAGVIESKDKFDLSSPFHVILNARGWAADEVNLTIVVGNQSQPLTLTTSGTGGSFEQYLLNFAAEPALATIKIQPDANNRIEIDRIQIISGTAALVPEISVDKVLTVPAAGDVCTLRYSIKNPVEGQKISAQSNQAWLNNIDTSRDGEVSFIVDENTMPNERVANLTLSYEGAESVVITVNQGIILPPEIVVENALTIPAATGIHTVNYSINNPVEGQKISAQSDQAWLNSLDVNVDGEVSFIVEENTAELERIANITLSYSGAQDVAIRVTQAGSGQVVAVSYTTLFGSAYNSAGVQAYDKSFDSTNEGFTVTLQNWNNNNNGWSYVRAGSKKAASTATISTKAAVVASLKTITVTIDAVAPADVVANKLEVASDSGFSNIVETVQGVEMVKGDVVYNISNPTPNCFYRLTYELKKTSKNGTLQISKIVYAN